MLEHALGKQIQADSLLNDRWFLDWYFSAQTDSEVLASLSQARRFRKAQKRYCRSHWDVLFSKEMLERVRKFRRENEWATAAFPSLVSFINTAISSMLDSAILPTIRDYLKNSVVMVKTERGVDINMKSSIYLNKNFRKIARRSIKKYGALKGVTPAQLVRDCLWLQMEFLELANFRHPELSSILSEFVNNEIKRGSAKHQDWMKTVMERATQFW